MHFFRILQLKNALGAMQSRYEIYKNTYMAVTEIHAKMSVWYNISDKVL